MMVSRWKRGDGLPLHHTLITYKLRVQVCYSVDGWQCQQEGTTFQPPCLQRLLFTDRAWQTSVSVLNDNGKAPVSVLSVGSPPTLLTLLFPPVCSLSSVPVVMQLPPPISVCCAVWGTCKSQQQVFPYNISKWPFPFCCEPAHGAGPQMMKKTFICAYVCMCLYVY